MVVKVHIMPTRYGDPDSAGSKISYSNGGAREARSPHYACANGKGRAEGASGPTTLTVHKGQR